MPDGECRQQRFIAENASANSTERARCFFCVHHTKWSICLQNLLPDVRLLSWAKSAQFADLATTSLTISTWQPNKISLGRSILQKFQNEEEDLSKRIAQIDRERAELEFQFMEVSELICDQQAAVVEHAREVMAQFASSC